GRGDRGGGVLKGLVGLLHQLRAVLPEPAHRRPGRRLIHLHEESAALVELELGNTLHHISHHANGPPSAGPYPRANNSMIAADSTSSRDRHHKPTLSSQRGHDQIPHGATALVIYLPGWARARSAA